MKLRQTSTRVPTVYALTLVVFAVLAGYSCAPDNRRRAVQGEGAKQEVVDPLKDEVKRLSEDVASRDGERQLRAISTVIQLAGEPDTLNKFDAAFLSDLNLEAEPDTWELAVVAFWSVSFGELPTLSESEAQDFRAFRKLNKASKRLTEEEKSFIMARGRSSDSATKLSIARVIASKRVFTTQDTLFVERTYLDNLQSSPKPNDRKLYSFLRRIVVRKQT